MNNKILAALILPLLAGCVSPQEGFATQKPTTPAQRAAIVQGARNYLKDPYSIRDAEISYQIPAGSGNTFVCIKANAKNSFGGYTGRKGWLVIFNSAGLITDAAEGHAYCNYPQIRYQPFPEINALKNL